MYEHSEHYDRENPDYYRRMKAPLFTSIDMTKEELHSLIGEVERSNLSPEVGDKLIAVIKTIEYLLQVIEDKSIAVGRLVRMIFGKSTESSKNIVGKTAIPFGINIALCYNGK